MVRAEVTWMSRYIGSLAFCALAALSKASPQSQVLIRGPVEALNEQTAQVKVLGQWVASSGASEGIEGQVVAVSGAIDARGNYVVSGIQQLGMGYVEGATPVFLSGVISSMNKAVGVAVVGGISVDYTGALHSLAAESLAVGKVVSFSGVHYSGDKIYATSEQLTQELRL